MLNNLWKCGLTENELITLSLKLGADVPVFIYGRTVFAEGIGELLTPVDMQEKWYLVAYPRINISTSTIFKDPELPCNIPKRSITTLLKCKFSNTCESVVKKRFYKVKTALSWLSRYAPSRLTGTGSCVFSEFENESSALYVLNQAPEWLDCFVAQGINYSPLKNSLILKNNM